MRLLHWLRPVAVGTAIGFCLAAVLLLTRLSTGAVTCTDTWIATDGNWASAANWSKGSVPGEGDTACITGTGTYTVLVNSNSPVVVSTLTLGAASGTQTLVIGSGIAFYGSITVNAFGTPRLSRIPSVIEFGTSIALAFSFAAVPAISPMTYELRYMLPTNVAPGCGGIRITPDVSTVYLD